MKKSNEIRSKYLQDSLLDLDSIATTLKENANSTVKDLLDESVRRTFSQLLSEDKDEEEAEVEDTDVMDDIEEVDAESEDDASMVDNEDDEEGNDFEADFEDEDGGKGHMSFKSGSDDEGGKWAQFSQYKVNDGEYDFSNAEDDKIVDAYKMLGEDDEVAVKETDGNTLEVTDNETGTEYIIDLDALTAVKNDGFDEEDSDFSEEEMDSYIDDEIDDDSEEDSDVDDLDDEDLEVEVDLDDDDEEDDDDEDFDDDDAEDELEDEADEDMEDYEEEGDDDTPKNKKSQEDMKESKIFEVYLNERNDFTDNYQREDAMTTPGMEEPGKNVDDWDAGVPKGKSKPWSGYKKQKSADQPFTEGYNFAVNLNEEEDPADYVDLSQVDGVFDSDEDTFEEATNVGGFVQQNSVSKSHVSNSNGRSARSMSKGGERKHGTVNPRYSSVDESIMRKANQVLRENRELKEALKKFRAQLQEAAVTNLNLGQIIKLFSENATTLNEKKEIIARFGTDAPTIKESHRLYNSISNELKKKGCMSLTEERQYGVIGDRKLNETQIYQDKEMLKSLDLMHKLCK